MRARAAPRGPCASSRPAQLSLRPEPPPLPWRALRPPSGRTGYGRPRVSPGAGPGPRKVRGADLLRPARWPHSRPHPSVQARRRPRAAKPPRLGRPYRPSNLGPSLYREWPGSNFAPTSVPSLRFAPRAGRRLFPTGEGERSEQVVACSGSRSGCPDLS